MIPKEFDDLTKADIDALISSGVSEGPTIEYKEQLPRIGNDEDSKEFLADVSSLANARGGDLIYGIRDKRDSNGKPTGTPEALGLAGINPDQQWTRLLNMLRDGIDPRIQGVRIKHIDAFSSGPVIVLRVPKSWVSPHMVKFKGSSRFYLRTSAGKHQLDVREIRESFLASESISEKISAFRSDRVGKILAGETPIPLCSGPKIVLHLLSIRSFSEGITLDLKTTLNSGNGKLKPMGDPGQWGPLEFNFNGIISSGSQAISPIKGYVQLFRNGAIEGTCGLRTHANLFSGAAFEHEVLSEAPSYISIQTSLGFGPPLFIAITLLSAAGLTIAPSLNEMPWGWPARPIREEVLMAPEVFVESERFNLATLIRPALDVIWQASAWPGSQGYDEAGNRVGFLKHHSL